MSPEQPAPPPEPQRLPGVGQRLDLVDDDGRPVTVVRRKDGTVEIHAGDAHTYLPPTQARALGVLASGHFRMPPGLFERTEGGRTMLAARAAMRDAGAKFPVWFYMTPGQR